MNLPDGPGWSPDGGEYWVKDGVLYWSDGTFRKFDDGGCWAVRTMPYEHTNDYSALSDEDRAALVEKCTKQREAYQAERRKEQEAREALRVSARAKLTEEEIEAMEYQE